MHNLLMRLYEWDPLKAELNLRKHEVSFADAVAVFADSFAITIEDDDPDEDRWLSRGAVR